MRCNSHVGVDVMGVLMGTIDPEKATLPSTCEGLYMSIFTPLSSYMFCLHIALFTKVRIFNIFRFKALIPTNGSSLGQGNYQ